MTVAVVHIILFSLIGRILQKENECSTIMYNNISDILNCSQN